MRHLGRRRIRRARRTHPCSWPPPRLRGPARVRRRTAPPLEAAAAALLGRGLAPCQPELRPRPGEREGEGESGEGLSQGRAHGSTAPRAALARAGRPPRAAAAAGPPAAPRPPPTPISPGQTNPAPPRHHSPPPHRSSTARPPRQRNPERGIHGGPARAQRASERAAAPTIR